MTEVLNALCGSWTIRLEAGTVSCFLTQPTLAIVTDLFGATTNHEEANRTDRQQQVARWLGHGTNTESDQFEATFPVESWRWLNNPKLGGPFVNKPIRPKLKIGFGRWQSIGKDYLVWLAEKHEDDLFAGRF